MPAAAAAAQAPAKVATPKQERKAEKVLAKQEKKIAKEQSKFYKEEQKRLKKEGKQAVKDAKIQAKLAVNQAKEAEKQRKYEEKEAKKSAKMNKALGHWETRHGSNTSGASPLPAATPSPTSAASSAGSTGNAFFPDVAGDAGGAAPAYSHTSLEARMASGHGDGRQGSAETAASRAARLAGGVQLPSPGPGASGAGGRALPRSAPDEYISPTITFTKGYHSGSDLQQEQQQQRRREESSTDGPASPGPSPNAATAVAVAASLGGAGETVVYAEVVPSSSAPSSAVGRSQLEILREAKARRAAGLEAETAAPEVQYAALELRQPTSPTAGFRDGSGSSGRGNVVTITKRPGVKMGQWSKAIDWVSPRICSRTLMGGYSDPISVLSGRQPATF